MSGEAILVIREMTVHDVAEATHLSTSVGWNQTAADWHRMRRLEPAGCFVCEWNGQIAGTTICCVFGSVAWLAMVIVREDLRGQGLGKRLVQAGLEFAQRRGVQTVRLDATALGEKVYRNLGFRPGIELKRMGGISTPLQGAEPVFSDDLTVEEAAEDDLSSIAGLDFASTRIDRRRLLCSMFEEWRPLVAKAADGQLHGFLAHREGRLATQLGPCAGSGPAAELLLDHALRRAAGMSLIVDVPSDHVSLLSVAQRYGLVEQRTLLRMTRGPDVSEDRRFFHVSYGGELG